MITFMKKYPDFSFMPRCKAAVPSETSSWIYLFYIAYFLESLPDDASVVYSGPARGKSLVGLAPFLQRHHVMLVDNFCMLPEGYETVGEVRTALEKNIRTCELPSVKFIEEPFQEVWQKLSGIDFLLLDGPPTISNFSPFSESFVFMMHDINSRLAGQSWQLNEYLPYLCRVYDPRNLENLKCSEVDEEYKQTHYNFYRDASTSKYGPHGWFIGSKG